MASTHPKNVSGNTGPRRGRPRTRRQVSVHSELRRPPDLYRLGRALARLALEQVAREAAEEQIGQNQPKVADHE